jgi:hypothetical protein
MSCHIVKSAFFLGAGVLVPHHITTLRTIGNMSKMRFYHI